MGGGCSGGAAGGQKKRQGHDADQLRTVVSHHRGHLLIAVCDLSITANQGQRQPLLSSRVPRSAEGTTTG